jgi:hypothetical protein
MGMGSSSGSKVADKIAGYSVLYLQRGDTICKIHQVDEGLYLRAWKKRKVMDFW